MWSSTAFGSQIIDFKGPEGQNSGNYTSGSGGPAGGNGQTAGPSGGSGTVNGGGTGNTGSTPGVSVTKPTIASEGAVLLNASTGEVLFEKNGTSRFYPASITKLMTALLTAENCALSDTVTSVSYTHLFQLTDFSILCGS